MKDTLNGLGSYGTAGFSVYMSSMCFGDWWQVAMGFGSAVLLAARLYVDVPRAYKRWRERNGK